MTGWGEATRTPTSRMLRWGSFIAKTREILQGTIGCAEQSEAHRLRL